MVANLEAAKDGGMLNLNHSRRQLHVLVLLNANLLIEVNNHFEFKVK